MPSSSLLPWKENPSLLKRWDACRLFGPHVLPIAIVLLSKVSLYRVRICFNLIDPWTPVLTQVFVVASWLLCVLSWLEKSKSTVASHTSSSNPVTGYSCPLWRGSKELLLFFLVKRIFFFCPFCEASSVFPLIPEITRVEEGFPGGWEGLLLDFWTQKLQRGLEGRERCFESRNCIRGDIGSAIWVIWGGFSWLSDPRDQRGGSLGFWTWGLCGVSPWLSDPECGNLKPARLFPGPFKETCFFFSLV